MKEVTHIRKGHLIFLASGALFKDCGSINEAKRMCRLMQKEGVKDRWVVKAEEVKRPKPRVYASRAEKRRTKPPERRFKPRTPEEVVTIAQAMQAMIKIGEGWKGD